MKIGVRAHDYGKLEIDAMAKVLYEEGYECAQLVLPKAFQEISKFEDVNLCMIEKIRTTFEKWNIEIAVLGCYVDLGNPNDEIRNKAVDTFQKHLVYNKELGAKVVATETACTYLNQEEKKVWYPYMQDSIKRIVDKAVKLDLKVALEPVYCHPLENLDSVLDVIEQIHEEKHLGLIFDASNLLKFPYDIDQKMYWGQWLKAIGRYLDAMHLKNFITDENGQRHATLLGEGIINYEVIAEWLNENEPEMYLLREEMNPAKAKEDILFMRQFCTRG